MYVEMKNGWLMPSFRYDERIVKLVKTMTGRSYDRSSKRWYIPCYHVDEVMEKLSPIGFRFSPDVLDYRDRLEAHRASVEAAKEDGTVYKGRLAGTLFPFQRTGAGFLTVAERALLADQMGLGKTIQTIAAVEGCDRVLILCPATNKYGWRDEIRKWAPEKSAVVIGGKPAERAALWASPAHYYIANYELLLRPDDLRAVRAGFDAVVADEAHRIANGQAQTTRAVKTIPARKRYALTGTPISNKPGDVWSIVDWLLPGYLGTWYQFTEQYAMFDSWEGEGRGAIVGWTDLKGLARRMRPVMLRRTKEEVLKDLPKKTVKDVVFDLSLPELKVYDSVRKNVLEGIKESQLDVDRGSLNLTMTKMLRLKQVTDHTGLVGDGTAGSTKLDILVEMLTEVIANGEKAIVFTQFAEMAKLIMNRLELQEETLHPLLIAGEVDHKTRQDRVDMFNGDSGHNVMVMTEAGAYGLNLQAASYVFHFDLPWSLAKTLQREDRAHRIGQTRPVTIVNLVAKGTIDEYVAKVLKRKSRDAVKVLEDDVRLEKEGLSAEDIKEILRI